MSLIIWLINAVFQGLMLLVLAQVILSYFMAPYHPVRMWIDRIVEPLLAPIRRVMPRIGMFDFSPMVLLILLQLGRGLLINLILAFV